MSDHENFMEIAEAINGVVSVIDDAVTTLCEEQPTLRDRFAMAALQGMLANSQLLPDVGSRTEQVAADISYKFADAMLAEREKKE